MMADDYYDPIEPLIRFPAESPYQIELYEQVPNLHRHLNGFRDHGIMKSRAHEDPNIEPEDHRLSYWFTAYYLMKAVLAWSDCCKGLITAFDNRGELQGPVRVLYESWEYDELCALAYWCWVHRGGNDEATRWSKFESKGNKKLCRKYAGYHGLDGADSYHLENHISWILSPHQYCADAELKDKPTVVWDSHQKKAMLLIDRFAAWPGALSTLSREVPLGPPSRHVHVVSRHLGYLGKFRRCWQCGRWFQGQARFHLWGHAEGK